MKRGLLFFMLGLLVLGSSVVLADDTDIEYRGWGLRVGGADGPDQVLAGFHLDLGQFAERVRFRPDLELGFGDDVDTLFVTAPVHYLFRVDSNVQPYAGGGLTAGWFDPDGGRRDFEIGLKATGGAEWQRDNGRAFFLELELGFSDVHDAQIVAGWTF